MGAVFIAVENQGSAFGFKDINTSYKEKEKPSPREAKKKERVYESRREAAEAAEIDPTAKGDRSFGDVLFTLKTLATRNGWTIGVAGSLKSLMKRLQSESTRQATSFDTVVFYGHGNYGVMGVGIGNIDTKPSKAGTADRDGSLTYRKQAVLVGVEGIEPATSTV